ncbi:MAG: calcium-binding protein [Polyangiaceae bacterium]
MLRTHTIDRQLARVLTVLSALAIAPLAACEDGDSTNVGGQGGEGSGGSSDGGGSTVVDAPPACSVLGADADYPGYDRAAFDGQAAPDGCSHGYDINAKAFRLTLSGPTRISFVGGKLSANGTECTNASGVAVPIAGSVQVFVDGTTGDDRLAIDAEGGLPTNFTVDLGDGADQLVLKGSPGADHFAVWSTATGLAIDFDDDGESNGSVAGAELVVASLGPAADVFDAALSGKAVEVPMALCGGAGDDELRAGLSTDRLEGGPGNDRLLSSAEIDSADLYDGGDDDDLVSYADRTDPVFVTIDDKADDGADGEADMVTNVEWIEGGQGDDVLLGTEGSNRIWGLAGNDTIDGGLGDDQLFGGEGDDTFPAGDVMDGADLVNGGPGFDQIRYDQRAEAIDATACSFDGDGECSVDQGCACEANDGEAAESDKLVNVEGVWGGPKADHLVGDDTDNQLFGFAGDDVLIGGAGDDSLFGDDGADQLDGGVGDDYLDGGDGADVFAGGEGDGDICVTTVDESPAQCELH